jgi:hypothetical protein
LANAAGHEDQKLFLSDYPRRFLNRFWFWWFQTLDALPVALALTVAFGLARCGVPISLLGFPPRPLPRRFPTLLAAIPLAHLPRTKTLIASFQQTTPHP